MFNVKVADMQHTPNSLKQLEIKEERKNKMKTKLTKDQDYCNKMLIFKY